MDKTTKLYQDLFNLFRVAFPKKNPAQAQTELNEIWKEKVKKSFKDKVDDKDYRELTEGWKKIADKRKNYSISNLDGKACLGIISIQPQNNCSLA